MIKSVDKKEPTGTSCNQESPSKRVHFASDPHIEELENEAEDPEMDTDKEPGSTSIARVPSFYIGKPLKDYDATNGRVSCFHYK